MSTTTTTEARPIALTAVEVRAIRDTGRATLRRRVNWTNSTVLGYPAKPYWSRLLFEHAVARNQSSLMLMVCGANAPEDVHLSVPFRHPDDPIEPDINNYPWYRVRPIWEAGDTLWVKEAIYILSPFENLNAVDDGGKPWPWHVTFVAAWHVTYVADTSLESTYFASHNGIQQTPRKDMPRWASRYTVAIAATRVEQDAAGVWWWDVDAVREQEEGVGR